MTIIFRSLLLFDAMKANGIHDKNYQLAMLLYSYYENRESVRMVDLKNRLPFDYGYLYKQVEKFIEYGFIKRIGFQYFPTKKFKDTFKNVEQYFNDNIQDQIKFFS